eukprot:scaffold97060_cov57-Phaeocystis_antarctica.AAC.3
MVTQRAYAAPARPAARSLRSVARRPRGPVADLLEVRGREGGHLAAPHPPHQLGVRLGQLPARAKEAGLVQIAPPPGCGSRFCWETGPGGRGREQWHTLPR